MPKLNPEIGMLAFARFVSAAAPHEFSLATDQHVRRLAVFEASGDLEEVMKAGAAQSEFKQDDIVRRVFDQNYPVRSLQPADLKAEANAPSISREFVLKEFTL